MPFAPKGEVARWRAVYRLFEAAGVGKPITYQQMAEVLDLDPVRDRERIQAAARQAAARLLREEDRAVESVPRVGYRLVDAERQIPLAGMQVERAVRSMEKGKDLSVHVRMDELSDEGRQIVQAMALGFSHVAEYARQIGRRMEDHEGRLDMIEAELNRLRAERSE